MEGILQRIDVYFIVALRKVMAGRVKLFSFFGDYEEIARLFCLNKKRNPLKK